MSSTNNSPPTMQPACGFITLPIEIGQKIAALLDDKDLVSFMAVCPEARDAIEGDGGSLWRRRFLAWFETPQPKVAGQRQVGLAQIKTMYQERKSVLNVIDQVFQIEGNQQPKLAFDIGRSNKEKAALRVLRDLITEAFCDKHDDNDTGYVSKNLLEIAEFTQKTNILKILGMDNVYLKPRDYTGAATPLLYTIQCVLAPFLFRFDEWHRHDQFGFHEAQMMVYSDCVMAPILTGSNGQCVNLIWLSMNIQFWRHHYLTEGEPLSPYFEGLEEHELPGLWSSQLSQGKRELGRHWKGSYAFVDREEINIIRTGKSGQGSTPQVQDKLNGEEDPDTPFQLIELELACDDDSSAWNRDFEGILKSLKTPKNKSRTRAQKSAPGGAGSNEYDWATSSYRFGGHGNDDAENFHMEGWLNQLPPQNGIPGWQRVTMMKYFVERDGSIDMEALWAYEGLMLPGGKIMIGRWWCPTDGNGSGMYSGPFILWNVPSTACECTVGPCLED